MKWSMSVIMMHRQCYRWYHTPDFKQFPWCFAMVLWVSVLYGDLLCALLFFGCSVLFCFCLFVMNWIFFFALHVVMRICLYCKTLQDKKKILLLKTWPHYIGHLITFGSHLLLPQLHEPASWSFPILLFTATPAAQAPPAPAAAASAPPGGQYGE